MKKAFSLFILISIAVLRSNAQSEVPFKIKMLPNRTYSSVMKMKMNMEMNYDDPAAVKNAKGSSAPTPMVVQTETSMSTEMQTGALTPANDFPFTMSLKQLAAKSMMNGKETPSAAPGPDQVMTGRYTTDGKMELQSISGTAMTDAMKEQMSKVVKNIMGAIEFPEKSMKPGDTFTQEIPFDMPLPGMTPKLTMKGTYKLIDIVAGKANFDLAFVITVDAQSTIKMNGTGAGKMVYDIATNYPTSTVENMTLTYNLAIPQQPTHLSGKMDMTIDMQAVVK